MTAVSHRFSIMDPVGAGNFGVIHRGVDRDPKAIDDSSVAIKELKRPINLELLNREIRLQYRAQVACPNIVQLHHIIESRPNEKYLLVMELLPMDLRCFLTAFYCPHRASLLASPSSTGEPRDEFQATYGRRYVPLAYIKHILAGLLNALVSVHAQSVAHRDVKPENILVEPLGLEHPLRGVHAPSAVVAGCGTPLSDTGSLSSPTSPMPAMQTPPRTQSPTAVCVALQDGMTVDEIIATVRAVHCSKCHAQLAEKQPRLAALTAAALRANEVALCTTHPAACSPDGSKADLPTVSASATNTTSATAAGISDTTASEAAVCTQASSLSDDAAQDSLKQPDMAEVAWPAPMLHLPVLGASCSGVSLACSLRPEVKLGDFGSARDMQSLAAASPEARRSGLTGCPTTYVYCAPEMMLHQAYDTPVDVWAAGMILFELATGELLLRPGQLVRLDGSRQASGDFSVTYRLMRMIFMLGTPTQEEWAAIADPALYPPEMRDVLPQIRGSPLFDAAAQAAQEERGEAAASPSPSAAAVKTGAHKAESAILGRLMYDALGADGVDLLRRLIAYDPARRITAKEALQHPFFSSL